MYPPRSGLLGLRPAVSSATPSWVRPGTGTCKLHTSVGRTRERQQNRFPFVMHLCPRVRRTGGSRYSGIAGRPGRQASGGPATRRITEPARRPTPCQDARPCVLTRGTPISFIFEKKRHSRNYIIIKSITTLKNRIRMEAATTAFFVDSPTPTAPPRVKKPK